MPLQARPTVDSDVPDIEDLSQQLYGRSAGVSTLLETSLLCITCVDVERDEIVGFMCLDDTPCIRMAPTAPLPGAMPWLAESKAAKSGLTATAFVSVAAIVPEHDVEASTTLLRAVYSIAPSMAKVVMCTTEDITFREPGLAALFNRTGSSREAGAHLYEAPRSSVLQPLIIRRARVEDHDDMVPVLQRAEVRTPALAKLPETSRPEEAFALARVVSGQDANNCVLVVLDPLSSALVGFIVMTSEVDTSALQDSFDLHPYDCFLPEELYEERYQAASDSVRRKKMSKLQAAQKRKQEQEALEAEEEGGTREAGTQPEGEGAEGEGAGDAEAEREAEKARKQEQERAELEEKATPTEEEIRAEMVALFAGQDDEACTIFAVTMLCIDEAYESQADEFLEPAFQAFPGKSYCVVTLPHSSPEPPLMNTLFARVPPLAGALFPEVLYLFNSNALLEGFEVRLAQEGDAEGVEGLMAGMSLEADIKELFLEAQKRGTAVVAMCCGEVVGLCTINPSVDLTLLEANFMLSRMLYLPGHPTERHAEIDMYCINPIFAHRHRDFLSAAQRLLKRSCLYYALPPGQAPPDMLDALLQVPARHRTTAAEQPADFALYLYCRRYALVRRQGVNAQVVVVGASECGLAAVERLLLDRQHLFNYVTLLAPGGISVGGVACAYTAGVIARMGLEARVTLVDAELVGLDREQRLVELSDGSALAYDLLLVTSGLQEQARNELGERDPEVAGSVLSAIELAADFSVADASVMTAITVYGHSLDAYHAMATLESRSAGDKTRWRAEPGEAGPLVGVLAEAAERLGVTLPQPEPMTLTSLTCVDGDLRPHAVFEGNNPTTGAPAVEEGIVDLLIGCRPPDASRALFHCLNNAGVVYDGRVVVDGSFRTNDPHIYAAGTVAKLSRRLGRDVHFEHYNSKEVGSALADSVVASFAGEQRPDEVPQLRCARVQGCSVPGGLTFLMAGCPTSLLRPQLSPPPGGRAVHTTTERGIFQINLDPQLRVHSCVYLGKAAIPAYRLSSLVGLHINYLNGVLTKFEAGQLHDLATFLSEPWADLLMHDSFPDLRSQLLASGLADLQEGALRGGDEEASSLLAASRAQEAVLDFMRTRQHELPTLPLPSMPAAAKA